MEKSIQNIVHAHEFMVEKVESVSPDLSIFNAINLLLKKRISGVPVVENDKVVGILSSKDCLNIALECKYQNYCFGDVKDYMSTEVIGVRPEADLFEIIELFDKKGLRRLPVIDEEGHLKGIISRNDVLKKLLEEKTWLT